MRRAVSMTVVTPPVRSAPSDHGTGPQEPRVDVLAADEVGRFSAEDRAKGRHAGRPSEIPPHGWWAVVRRVTREAISDEVGMAAASCAFYAMLALFPAISVAISLYGLIADPVAIESQLEGLRDVVPASTYQIISVRVHDLAAAGPTKLSWGLALSLLVARCGAP
jgi:membrane protein